jgi:hypothetical protein
MKKTDIELIKIIDDRMNAMLVKDCPDKDMLIQMLEYMPRVKEILESNDEVQLDMYIKNYKGFYHYIKMIENLAVKIASSK